MKIRGNTVGTTLSPEKALVKARNLTEEEKAQARANIGAAAEGDSPGGSGADGFSPVANVTQTDTGAVVTITDKSGTTTATIVNGKDGEKGDTGEQGVGVSYVTQTSTSNLDGGNNIIAVGLTNGKKSTFTVRNGSKGSKGEKGEDGYTPVKGVDYFTEAEKQELAEQAAQMVDVPEVEIPTALPNPNALTFTGAVSATYDGSKAVSIEIPSGGGSGGSGGASVWTHIDTIDLSSGALSYEFDTTGYNEIMLVNTAALTMSGNKLFWKDVTRNVANQDTALQKNVGSIMNLNYLGNGYIVWLGARASDTLLNTHVIANAKESNNTLRLTFSSVTSGTIVIAGRA